MALPCSERLPWANYPGTQQHTPSSTCTPYSLDDLVSIVQQAERQQRHVHAFGSSWSFSDCAITTDYAVDMTALNGELQTVQKALNFKELRPHIYHVEAGITIYDLYKHLDRRNLALETMGGASGQTLAGAISTGTHGGDYLHSPLADSVLAIHLVGVAGRQYWIEREPGITNAAQLQEFVVPGIDPANIIYDNDTFNAVLVSMGCMGIIYAVVLRVRDQYELMETTTATTWKDFIRASSRQLNDPNNRFLQVAIDPYDNIAGNRCLVTTRREGPATGVSSCAMGDLRGAIMAMAADMVATAPVEAVQIGVPELINHIRDGANVDTIYDVLARVSIRYCSGHPASGRYWFSITPRS